MTAKQIEVFGFSFAEVKKEIPEKDILFSHDEYCAMFQYPTAEIIKKDGEVWANVSDNELNWQRIGKLKKNEIENLKKLLPKVYKIQIIIGEDTIEDGCAEVWFVNLNGKMHKVISRFSNQDKLPPDLKKLSKFLCEIGSKLEKK
jgi:hypothetical protein